jgi:hypothetical protein
MIMKLFATKLEKLTAQHIDFSERLAKAQAEAATAEASLTQAALADNGALEKVEAVAIAAQTRVRSLTGALVQLALDISVEQAAQILAERRPRIEQAIATLMTWRDGAEKLRTKFVPLIAEAKQYCAAHDGGCIGHASQMLKGGMDAMNSALVIMDVATLDFNALLTVLRQYDDAAYDQSGRVLSAKA